MAHEKADAFDREDLAMMLVLSDFAAMAVRQLHQQSLQIKLAAAAAAASMANDLAHEINNPLQSLTNLVYLASQGTGDVPSLSQEISTSLDRLSRLVSKLLTLPIDTVRAQ
jgi:nitrogen-specific signal transduction histidine kinase